MELLLSVVVGLVFILGAVRLLSPEKRKPLRDGLSAAQTVAALAAILLALAWYLKARPDAPRVELGLTADAYPLDDRKVLVRAVYTIKNIGRTGLALDRKELVQFDVQQAWPFEPLTVEADLQRPTTQDKPRDRRLGFATIRRDWVALKLMMETGEPDSVSYEAILDCRREQLVLVTASLPKPALSYEPVLNALHIDFNAGPREATTWGASTMLDLRPACGEAG